MSLIPFNPQRFTDSQLFLKEVDGNKLLVKAYLNEDKFARRNLEIAKSRRWRNLGFVVPEILNIRCDELAEPHIVMRYIPGMRLSEYLKDKGVATEEKLNTLKSVFDKNYMRHDLALSNQDLLLIHTDPNTDNIILGQGVIWFIDFEHISKTQDVLTGVGKEVTTFARRVIKDIGIERTDEVIHALLQAYQFNNVIMSKVEELTFERPFQFVHRLKHRLRKRTQPGLVTRYDIADAVRKLRLFHNK
ncbi:MAG TPA: hypothetical protein VFF75_05020 [Methylophilaceae bacterium]|nr:hypothetical protein [Methylophilaceae bacterium]